MKQLKHTSSWEHSGHSYWWVKKSWWFAVKNLLIIVLLISTFVLMRKCWCLFFRWSLKTNIKCCFYTVTTFCFSFLATLTKAKHFNHRNNLMINTWTKVCLGKTILCVQTQKKGWWWQRSTIFLSLPLSLFFLVMIVKNAKKKQHPKRLIINRFFFQWSIIRMTQNNISGNKMKSN